MFYSYQNEFWSFVKNLKWKPKTMAYPVVRRNPVTAWIQVSIMPRVIVDIRLYPAQRLQEPHVFVARVVRHEVQDELNVCKRSKMQSNSMPLGNIDMHKVPSKFLIVTIIYISDLK
jgi:hypothetical protein